MSSRAVNHVDRLAPPLAGLDMVDGPERRVWASRLSAERAGAAQGSGAFRHWVRPYRA